MNLKYWHGYTVGWLNGHRYYLSLQYWRGRLAGMMQR
jgi:hypothetical protein